MTEDHSLLPDWETFDQDYIQSGLPQRFVVRTSPHVYLFIDQGADRIGASFELASPRAEGQVLTLSQIHVDDAVRDGRHHIEIWTNARPLFANFYRLVSEIVRSVVDDAEDPDAALSAAVLRWEALLSRQSLMPDEAQTGLFGELWLLERLIGVHGLDALDAWVGPAGQAHDFRMGDVELEVKTTSGTQRNHRINGLNQLQPSVDCSLYLLSLKVANAGAGGRSLPDVILDIEQSLSPSHAALARFRAALERVGYDAADAHLYTRRRRLRDVATLIPVTDGVPRLTPEAVAGLEPKFAAHRITSVVYAIDVEGLGHLDGSEQFTSILPAITSAGTP